MSALDDHIRDTLNRALDSIRGNLEAELGTFQEGLVRAANDAGTRIAAEAAESATADARREAEERLAEVREAAARDVEERQASAAAEVAALQRLLDEARDNATRQEEDAQRGIDNAKRDADNAKREVETATREADNTKREADNANRELDNAKRELESAQHRLETLEQEKETAQRDIEAARREIETSGLEIDTAEHELEIVRRELSQLTDAVRRADERLAQAARLPDAIRVLDEASTLGEVLDSLVRSAGREAGRAVVFLVKGDRLREYRIVGFEAESGAARLDMGLDEAGPMAEVVRSGQGVTSWGDEGQSLPSFAGGNGHRHAVSWPVAVGGTVVAVLYADGPIADNPSRPDWPSLLDVLARHSGRVLEAITVRQAAGLMTSRPATDGSPSLSADHRSAGSIGSLQ
ncbi:MAG TPA: hypothetical protein VI485_11730 [Vicinamibacterales bacterium]|nr:hypothetical protein [Vicinamibacterales bacterium]